MLTQTLSQTNLGYSVPVASALRPWRPSRRLPKILLDSDACFIDALHSKLMLEMPNPGKDHGETVPVSGGDNLVVADRTAGLNNSSDSMLRGFVKSVAKGKECV